MKSNNKKNSTQRAPTPCSKHARTLPVILCPAQSLELRGLKKNRQFHFGRTLNIAKQSRRNCKDLNCMGLRLREIGQLAFVDSRQMARQSLLEIGVVVSSYSQYLTWKKRPISRVIRTVWVVWHGSPVPRSPVPMSRHQRSI